MTHREKVERFVEEMRERQVKPYDAAPPLFRLLWALGLEVPPPDFLRPRTLASIQAIGFAVVMALVMWWLKTLIGDHPSLADAIVPSAMAGVLYGFAMAHWHARRTSRLRLPPWEEYGARPTAS